MGLDRYGYPATHMANTILIGLDDFGTETKQLESGWYDWLHYNPFDTRVAEKLATLFQTRINGLDPEQDADRLQQLQKKLDITQKRAKRYSRLATIKISKE
jgi:hypothetical protein